MKNLTKILLAAVLCFTAVVAYGQCGPGETQINVTIELPNDWSSEMAWEVTGGGTITATGATPGGANDGDSAGDCAGLYGNEGLIADVPGTSVVYELCVQNGFNYTFEAFDSFGDGWNGSTTTPGTFSVTIADDGGTGALNGCSLIAPTSGAGGGGCTINILGGTNTFFVDGDATIITGCMDPTAFNYNDCATVDDGNCVFPPISCNGAVVGMVDTTPGTYDNGLFSDVNSGNSTADNFSVAEEGIVNELYVEFFAGDVGSAAPTNDWIIEIFSDAAGTPGASFAGPFTLPANTITGPIGNGFGLDAYALNFDLTVQAIVLPIGDYWLAVTANGGSPGNGFGSYAWCSDDNSGGDGILAQDQAYPSTFTVFGGDNMIYSMCIVSCEANAATFLSVPNDLCSDPMVFTYDPGEYVPHIEDPANYAYQMIRTDFVTGEIIELSTSGFFSANPGLYNIYFISYKIDDQPDPGFAVGDFIGDIGITDEGCHELSGPIEVIYENCGEPSIDDPCSCFFDGPNFVAFHETIQINAFAGQQWILVATDPTNAANITTGMFTDETLTTPIPADGSSTVILLDGAGFGDLENVFHEDAVGYNAVFVLDESGNGSIDATETNSLSISNTCFETTNCLGIPTASEWGLIALALGLMSLVLIYVRKGESVTSVA